MKKVILVFFILLSFSSYSQSDFSIAFGSCLHPENETPILSLVSGYNPNVFVLLGDNIYGDTYNTDSLIIKYQQLESNETYKKLKEKTQILAVWDDHDYGKNDDGKYNPIKEKSKKIMLDFFGEDINSERRKREGIYTTYNFNCEGKTIQIILLDTRSFRSNLKKFIPKENQKAPYSYLIEYEPCSEKDSTFLGEKQWKWLKKELKKKSDLKVICSSTQFLASYNGYETWSNFPSEQKKLLNMIKQTKAQGIVFLSGDAHYAEISKLDTKNYPIYDFTSSGLSSTVSFAPGNLNRVGEVVMENNFGLIECNFKNTNPFIQLKLIDSNNTTRMSQTIYLDQLKH